MIHKIPLTQGKVAIVDSNLFMALSQFKWCVCKYGKTFYAVRNVFLPDGRRRLQYMHRYIFELLALSVPRTVDHKDRNGLNNCLSNLRPATKSEQAHNCGKKDSNSSNYIGVYWHKVACKWTAQIQVNGTKKHLGLFNDKFSAAWVRDTYAKEHHGEFAAHNNLVDRRKVPR